ncbi:unnamed protein product, partial [Rotaria sp. Silwood1]
MRSFLYDCVLIISISLTIAIQLDGDCTSDTQCEGSNIVCRDRKCQCNYPAYTPCKSTCEINRRYAYEGENCEVNENCIDNAICSEKKCTCRPDFPARNGLCLKNLNVVCTNPTECWSQYCLNSRCQCAPGYEPSSNQIDCKRKLVNIFNTWSDANVQGAICYDDNSCIDIIANCIPISPNSTNKFCRCPIGYNVIDNNTRCEPIRSTLLSPLDSLISNYSTCGVCEDINALCIKAADQITCWCRFGYIKQNNQCVREQNRKPLIIYPNSIDLNLHNFADGCTNENNDTNEINNNLCVCASGYEFVTRYQSC